MKNQLNAILILLGGLTTTMTYAEETCKVEVAVSRPPIEVNQNVAFNVTSVGGNYNQSLTLQNGSIGPQFINDVPCSSAPYHISATLYSTPILSREAAPIGECTLKAGAIMLSQPGNSVSVVFPNDFNCPQSIQKKN